MTIREPFDSTVTTMVAQDEARDVPAQTQGQSCDEPRSHNSPVDDNIKLSISKPSIVPSLKLPAVAIDDAKTSKVGGMYPTSPTYETSVGSSVHSSSGGRAAPPQHSANSSLACESSTRSTDTSQDQERSRQSSPAVVCRTVPPLDTQTLQSTASGDVKAEDRAEETQVIALLKSALQESEARRQHYTGVSVRLQLQLMESLQQMGLDGKAVIGGLPSVSPGCVYSPMRWSPTLSAPTSHRLGDSQGNRFGRYSEPRVSEGDDDFVGAVSHGAAVAESPDDLANDRTRPTTARLDERLWEEHELLYQKGLDFGIDQQQRDLTGDCGGVPFPVYPASNEYNNNNNNNYNYRSSIYESGMGMTPLQSDTGDIVGDLVKGVVPVSGPFLEPPSPFDCLSVGGRGSPHTVYEPIMKRLGVPPLSIGRRYDNRYEKMWKENRQRSQRFRVLLYLIPLYKRDGRRNNQWSQCTMYFRSGEHHSEVSSSDWHCLRGVHQFDDPINSDRVFRFLLPKSFKDPIRFFVKDDSSDDRDYPGGWPGPQELSLSPSASLCYVLSLQHETQCGISTLRDGVMVPDDRASFPGICIRLEVKPPPLSLPLSSSVGKPQPHGIPNPQSLPVALQQDDLSTLSSLSEINKTAKENREKEMREMSERGEWCRPVLHYLDEITGKWCERVFKRATDVGEMCVTLLEVRSVTFAIRDGTSDRWIKSPSGKDFRVSYPGTYAVFMDGSVIECSSGDQQFDTTTPIHTQQQQQQQEQLRKQNSNGSHPQPPVLYSIATPRSDVNNTSSEAV